MLSKKNIKNYQVKGKTAYGSKKYANPFFQAYRKEKKRNAALFFTLIIFSSIAALLGFCVWLLLYSKYFKINELTVNALGNISQSEVEKVIWEDINSRYLILTPRANIFIFDPAKTEERLIAQFPLESIEIRKKYPHKLMVEYKEKEYAFVLKENEKYYYIDRAGHYIKEITDLAEINNIAFPALINQTGQTIVNNEIAVDENYFNQLNDLRDKLFAAGGLEIKEFIIDDEKNALKFKLNGGPVIIFSASDDIDKQIQDLLIIKNERLKDDFGKKEYINLKINDKIYIK